MSVLFLSHAPHDAHLGFAEEVGARAHLLPFRKYTELIKTYPFLGGYLYALISLIYSLFIRVDEDVLLIDGGSSLFVGVFLKKRYRKLKLVYLDADLLFYSIHKKHGRKRGKWNLFIDAIDGVISVSEANKAYASLLTEVPVEVCPPYPKDILRTEGERKNYGLYLGRLDPDKCVLSMLACVLSSPTIEKMVVVGDGSLRRRVRALAAQNPKLLYVGPTKDVGMYYNMCTYFIHLPDHDPHPTATLEAVLGGCIPILSRGVGTAYLFDDSFIVEDGRDCGAVKETLQKLASDKNRAGTLLAESVAHMVREDASRAKFKETFFSLCDRILV